jgi:hypothetical protein
LWAAPVTEQLGEPMSGLMHGLPFCMLVLTVDRRHDMARESDHPVRFFDLAAFLLISRAVLSKMYALCAKC